jgi:hypothetical protein
MTEPNEKVSKDALFSSIVAEAQGLHRQMVTIAVTFLGGTLLFLEKIATEPTVFSMLFLILGWAALIASVALSSFVRLKNLDAGRYALEEKYDEAARIDRRKECLSIVTIWCFIAGISFITIFGIVNLSCNRNCEGSQSMSEEKSNKEDAGQITPAIPKKKMIKKGSIPFGSTGPQQAQPSSSDQSESQQSDSGQSSQSGNSSSSDSEQSQSDDK